MYRYIQYIAYIQPDKESRVFLGVVLPSDNKSNRNKTRVKNIIKHIGRPVFNMIIKTPIYSFAIASHLNGCKKLIILLLFYIH